MKRNSPVSALLVLAVVLVAALTSGFANKAEAQTASLGQPVTRILPGKETVSAAYVDSSLFTIAAATTSTNPETLLIDTSDWDWVGPNGGGVTSTAYGVAFVNFTISGVGGVASGIDSLYCLYQTSPDGVKWSKQSATSLITWNNSDTYARMPILADSDALNSTSFFGQRYIRILVQGDTGGKLGGIQASVTYWPKGDTRVVNNPDASFR